MILGWFGRVPGLQLCSLSERCQSILLSGDLNLDQSDNINQQRLNVTRAQMRVPPDQLQFQTTTSDWNLIQDENRRKIAVRTPMKVPQNQLSLQGEMDFNKAQTVEFSARQRPGKAPRPKDTLTFNEGQLDVTTSKEILPQPKKSPLLRPKDTISLEGQLDLSRPHNINCQNVQIGKIQRIRPTQNLQLEGKMELNRGDSIHHQILALPKKISKGQRPKDGISLGGDLDFSRHDSINFLALNQSIKAPQSRPQSHLGSVDKGLKIEAESIQKSDYKWENTPSGIRRNKPQDRLKLNIGPFMERSVSKEDFAKEERPGWYASPVKEPPRKSRL